MKFIFAVLFIFGLVTIANGAFAAEATSTLSWSAPETRVDGSFMSIEEVDKYRIFYAVDGQPAQDSEYIEVAPGETSRAVTLDLSPRPEPYVVSFEIVVVDTEGRVSEPSETVSKSFEIVSTANPSAVTNVRFTVACGDGCTIEEVSGGQ